MSVASQRLRDLIALLESEERVYDDLRSLLQEEREYMATLDAAELARVVEAKEMTAAEARFLEKSRLEVARSLGHEIGLTGDRPTLPELCAALGPAAGRLREIHVRLGAILGAVRELVEANASFAGDSLIQVQDAIRLFGRMSTTDAIYDRSDPGAGGARAAVPGRLVRRSV